MNMDLGAYVQIEDLQKIADDNGIDIPRLRGYRLMKLEEPLSAEEINDMMKDAEIDVLEDLCCSVPFWNAKSNCRSYSYRTDRICESYLVKNQNRNDSDFRRYTGIRWDRIHGKKRKVLKFEIKKQKQRIRNQYDMWNKYAGKEHVLYVHSRIGGRNWDFFGGNELVKQPWFLDRVDDSFDRSYCDIYALIKED